MGATSVGIVIACSRGNSPHEPDPQPSSPLSAAPIVVLPANLALPVVQRAEPLDPEALVVVVSKSELTVGRTLVGPLVGLSANRDGSLEAVGPVFQSEVAALRSRRDASTPRANLYADQGTPVAVLDPIIRTAFERGIFDLSLVVRLGSTVGAASATSNADDETGVLRCSFVERSGHPWLVRPPLRILVHAGDLGVSGCSLDHDSSVGVTDAELERCVAQPFDQIVLEVPRSTTYGRVVEVLSRIHRSDVRIVWGGFRKVVSVH